MRKTTIIHGHKAGYVEPNARAVTNERWAQIEANRPFTVHSARAGHWSMDAAIRAARRMGVIGPVRVSYLVNGEEIKRVTFSPGN